MAWNLNEVTKDFYMTKYTRPMGLLLLVITRHL
jgi:hypothetical protein